MSVEREVALSPPRATSASATRSSAAAVRAVFSWASSLISNFRVLPRLLPRMCGRSVFLVGQIHNGFCLHVPSKLEYTATAYDGENYHQFHRQAFRPADAGACPGQSA